MIGTSPRTAFARPDVARRARGQRRPSARGRRGGRFLLASAALLGLAVAATPPAGASADAAPRRSLDLTLEAGPLTANGDGVFEVAVGCAGARGRCAVEIAVRAAQPRGSRARRVVVARRRVSIASGSTRRVPLALSRRGLGLLVSGSGFRLPVGLALSAGDRADHTARLSRRGTVSMAPPATGCWPPGSRTLVREGGGRVYFFPRPSLNEPPPNNESRSFGCLYKRGEGFALDDPFAPGVPNGGPVLQGACPPIRGMRGSLCTATAAIAGPYIAYAQSALYGGPTTIVVMDLESGEVVYTGPSIKTQTGAAPPSDAPSVIGVSSAGVAAWIVSFYPYSCVNALDSGGWHKVADSDAIDHRFVRVAGDTVSWRQRGRTRSKKSPLGADTACRQHLPRENQRPRR